MDSNVVLRAEHMNKIYPGTKALDDVSYEVMKGKVNVLIGENGAGKSTLMKLIAGIEQPSSGKIYMGDEEVVFKNTNDARERGIGIIHQELSLFPNLNIYQNIFMGREQTRGKMLLDNGEHVKATKRVLEKLEHVMNPNTLVGDLRVGQQQMIEIAREFLQDDLKILIMDEPTSSLSEQEVEVLFKLMREFTEAGIAIVYISHRLEEIMRIGDNVTILRDGKYVAGAEVSDIDVPWIVQQMVGEGKSYPKKTREVDWAKQETVLKVKDLCLPKSGGGYLLEHLDFELKRGEILGIYGLMGAGRTEVFECIMGLRPEHTGEIYKEGKLLKVTNLREQIDNGFAMVPEDRQAEGLVQTLSIGKNISLSSLDDYTKLGIINKKEENAQISKQIKDIMIKVADKDLPILSLSGGNQQKVVIGKGILTDPNILLLDEPSRGIDIGAKTEVFDIINQYAERGVSILVVSSELKEIVSIADRVIVLSNGRKTGEFVHGEITEDQLVLSSYKGHGTNMTEEEN